MNSSETSPEISKWLFGVCDLSSNNSHQTFATLTNVNLASIGQVPQVQFSSVNNLSINISTFQPQVLENEEEYEVEEENDNDVENVIEKVVENAVISKKRGHKPLSQEEIDRRAALKISEKSLKQAAKRAKITKK